MWFYFQTLHFNCILSEDKQSRYNQSIPIVLSLSETDKQRLDGTSAFTLRHNDKPVAILRNPEFYYQRKEERCSRQFGTNNADQPYIKVRQILNLKFTNLDLNK